MLRKDYLDRVVKQLAEAIGKMLGLIKAGLGQEAEAMLEDAYQTHLGLPRSLVSSLSEESKRRILGERGQLAALLLRAEADLRTAQGREAEAEAARRLADQLDES